MVKAEDPPVGGSFLLYMTRLEKARIWLWVLIAAAPALTATANDTVAPQDSYDEAVSATLAGETNPLQQLIIRARERRLADAPMWQALVHYQPTLTGSVESEVDAPWFFFSASGKTDPQRELEATLAAFFSAKPRPPMRLTPYCRFVARRHWLETALGETATNIPKQDCPEFERYKTFLNAEQLTVVFPSAHPNSPSSAFGHTLLRIDHRNQNAETRMLNMSINFAAEIPATTNTLSYIIGGINGGFKGKFRILPYHIKLREYGQIDNRDIWEFPLKLSQTQIDTIIRHSYEMLIAWYDYYFASENCAYHLLSLLDVAFPEKRLSNEFPVWTIPVDTIKLLDKRGLIQRTDFSPSMSRLIKAREQALPPTALTLAASAYQDGISSISEKLANHDDTTQANILDLVSDLQRYRRLNSDAENLIALSPEERETLQRRSRIAVKTRDPIPAPDGPPPHKGHDTTRVSLILESADGKTTPLLQFRPAYHDLLDPSPGYGDHAAIDFFNITAGWDQQNDKPFLRNFTLLDIQSLEPRDRFFKPISWRTRASWERKNSNDRHRFTLLGGGGVAWQNQPRNPLLFAFLEAALIDDTSLEERSTVFAGPRIGALWEPIAGWRIMAELEEQRDIVNAINYWRGAFQSSVAISKQFSLVVNASRAQYGDQPRDNRGSLSLRLYF